MIERRLPTIGLCAPATLLTAILPYLIIKREQALLLIEFATTIDKKGRWGRNGLPSSLLARRASMAARSLELNMKGPAPL